MAERLKLELSTDVAGSVSDTIDVLLALADERHGNPNGLYRRSTGASLVRAGSDGQSLASVDVAALRVLVHEASEVLKYKPAKGGPVLQATSYPADLAQAVLSTLPASPRLLRLPILDSVASSPVLLPDGRLLGPGEYSSELGAMVSPEAPVVRLPARLERIDAGVAARRLCDLVAQFPWVGESDQAAWLALVLTLVGRELVDGPTPMHVVTGNVRGAGKSLLVEIAGVIATGRKPAPEDVPTSKEEAAKTLLSIALDGQRLAFFDNVVNSMLGGPLDAALTAGYIRGRLLGGNKMGEAPWRAVVAATGNNLQVGGDLERRVLPIRLQSPLENPELREDLAIPNLFAYCQSHRLELLTSALTILAAWLRAGRPAQPLQAWGSYNAWTDTIRQAVCWVTGLDPCAHRLDWAAEADQRPSLMRVLLEAWPRNMFQPLELTSAELLARLEVLPGQTVTAWQSALLELLPREKGKTTARSIGYALKPWKNRTVGGLRLVSTRGGKNNLAAWTVAGDQPQENSGNGTHRPPSPAPSPATLDGLPC